MADLGTITFGTFDSTNSDAGMTITGTDPVLEAIGSTDDTDHLDNDTNADYTHTAYFAIDAMPGDFQSMDTLSIRLRYGRSANSTSKTWDDLQATIFQSDRSTVLASATGGGYQSIATSITTTTATNSSVIGFDVVTASDAATWNGAVLAIQFTATKIKGGAADDFRVYAGELTGTYTQAAQDISVGAAGYSVKWTDGNTQVESGGVTGSNITWGSGMEVGSGKSEAAYNDSSTNQPVIRAVPYLDALWPTTQQDAIDDNCYVQFALSGTNLDSLSADFLVSGGGTSTTRSWFLRSNEDSYATDIGSGDHGGNASPTYQSESVGLTGLSNTTDLTFRLYMYTTVSGQVMYFEDFEITGPTLPPIENTTTFGTPTVAFGISATSLSNTVSFGAPTVALDAQNISATTFTDGQTFGTATLGAGPVDIAATSFTDGQTFGSAAVASTVDIAVTTFTDGQTFGAPGLEVVVSLNPTTFDDSQTFGSPSLAPGPVDISVTFFTDGQTFGTAAASLQIINSNLLLEIGDNILLESGDELLLEDLNDVFPLSFDNEPVFGSPTLQVDYLAPESLANSEQFGTALLSSTIDIQPSTFDDLADTFGTATLGAGPVDIAATSFAEDQTFGTATLSATVDVAATSFTDGQTFGTAVLSSTVDIAPSSFSPKVGGISPTPTDWFDVRDMASGDQTIPSRYGSGLATLGSTSGSDGNDPTLNTAGVRPFLEFNGLNEYVTTDATTPSGSWTIVSVSRIDTQNASYTNMLAADKGGAHTDQGVYHYVNDQVAGLLQFNTLVNDGVGTSVVSGVFAVTSGEIGVGFSVYDDTADTLTSHWVDDTGRTTDSTPGDTSSLGSLVTGTGLWLGANTVAGSDLIGDMFTFLVIGSALSTSEIDDIAEFLLRDNERFPTPATAPGPVDITATSFTDDQTFGTATLASTVDIAPTSFAEDQTFGTAVLGAGPVDIAATTFGNTPTFGSATLSSTVDISATSFTDGQTFGTAVAANQAAGAITASTFTDGQTFGASVLGVGPVDIAAPSFSDGQTFGAAALSSTIDIGPASFTDGQTFGSPTLSSTVDIAATSFTDGQTFGTPTVAPGPVDIAATSFTDDQTFGSPSVITGLFISPSTFTDGQTFGSPTLQPGPVDIGATTFDSVESFGSPTLQPGSVDIGATSFTDGQTFGSPTLSSTVNIGATSFTDGQTFGSPTLQPGPVDIGATSFTDSQVFGAPTVELAGGTSQNINATSFTDGQTFGSPTVAPGAVELTPSLFGAVVTFGAPGLGSVASITPSSFADGQTFGSPGVETSPVIFPSSFSTAVVFGAPSLATDAAVGSSSLSFQLYVKDSYGRTKPERSPTSLDNHILVTTRAAEPLSER